MTFALSFVIMVGLGAFGDVLWARWSMACAAKRSLAAANWGALLPVFSAAAILIYKDDALFVLPYALGCWLGTFAAVRR